MERLIDLHILTLEKTLFKGKVSKVSLPGTAGRFTVLPNHAPLISSLTKGVVNFSENKSDAPNESTEHIVSVKRGFVEIRQNQIVVCIEKEEAVEKE